jgi:3'(2'), 5'-bisphosphate nucleotidase
LDSKYHIAIDAAITASEAILEIYSNPVPSKMKSDGSPVTIADLTSSKIIEEILATTGIPMIGEESVNLPYIERKLWTECWIVDPLDGTKEYLRRNDEFAVNIALVHNGEAIFGIIASPVEKMIAFGGKTLGVFYGSFEEARNQNAKKVEAKLEANNPYILACSRTPHHGEIKEFVETIRTNYPNYVELKKGSALKFIDLLVGTADIYPRFAPTMEWDVAAGQALLEGIGGSIVEPKSLQPLRYNKADLYNSWFIAKAKA